ncbi:DUF4013 domain-containing protein [Halorubraceae archaeon YAN]|nr:DUF4013 domain-containing protein [Halorubraceae archaeon YAN]
MIQESLQYLRNGDDPLKTVLIGGLLVILSPLLIPLFTLTGYILSVLRRTSNGDDTPPVFAEWVDTTIDGAKAWLVMFVYVVLPGIILTTAGALAVVSILSVSALPAELQAFAGILGFGTVALLFLLGTIAALAGLYITPAAVANYADTNSIRAGFALRTLWPVLTSREYLVGWLTAAVVILVGSLAAGLVGSIPVAGFIVGAVVSFYALVSAYYIIGQTWEDVRPQLAEKNGQTTTEQAAV